ncbi:MAG: vitamin B12 dependent-methionine synthase activation domain-containing protein, partial [Micrococcales bacterium]|nr:vitamin B12 dependent-methionine synthase activation domain-containing protein [Micrococcales bacterium]
LLIGGATTSAAHTAVKIDPAYSGTVAYVVDASRAVGVAGDAINREPELAARVEKQFSELRERHGGKQVTLVDLATARSDTRAVSSPGQPAPLQLGRHLLEPSLEELVDVIDWTPFFSAWELRGTYPKLLDDPRQGQQARELFADGQALLRRIIDEKLLTPRGVVALWPARRLGPDDIEITEPDGSTTVFHTLRQQKQRTNRYAALADFVAPEGDHLGGFAVGIHGAHELAMAFKEELDDYSAILAQALSDRLAEACAEWVHRMVRTQLWGYAPDEALQVADLVKERYDGIRPAPGYPAQPDHTEKRTLFRLLGADEIGLELTEHCAMTPTSAVSGLYLGHPESVYFAVGKVARDQVEDYARRKGWTLEEAERWLAPNLGYQN